MRKIYISSLFLLSFAFSFAQFNLGNLKDKIDNSGATNALKNHGKDKLRESLDNSRKEFDESNFNYAISFIDNSGTFENSEKGSSIGNTISNGKKFYQGNDISNEDKAYTNNRNGELFM